VRVRRASRLERGRDESREFRDGRTRFRHVAMQECRHLLREDVMEIIVMSGIGVMALLAISVRDAARKFR
jgi:hypothetical protein